jgi:hypothetical protein
MPYCLTLKIREKMKKVVRMLGLCALVALAFTSCKKKETNGTITFKASINQPTYDGRTHIGPYGGNNYVVLWNANDQIDVFNEASEKETYIANNVNDQSTLVATFDGNASFLSNLYMKDKYTAFYPAVGESEGFITLTIPQMQSHRSTTFANNTYPMWARNKADGNFEFTSDAGILNVRLRSTSLDVEPVGNYFAKVSHLRVYSANEQLCGTMKYNVAGQLVGFDGNGHEVIMQGPAAGITVPDDYDTNFYIILPENVLAGPFVVEVYAPGVTEPIKVLEGNSPVNKIEKHKVTVMPLEYIDHLPAD